MNIQLLLDSAILDEAARPPVGLGERATTNPTLLAKALYPRERFREISRLLKGQILTS